MNLPRSLSTLPLPPHLKEQLAKHGFNNQADVLELSPMQLAKELDISAPEALSILKCISNQLPPSSDVTSSLMSSAQDGKSALDLLRKKRSQRPIFTLNQQLDNLLGGGVPRGEVTEFCGVPGMGKTQMGMQLACDVQIPLVFGGTEGQAVYIDTEGSFMPERVAEVAQGLVDHLQTTARLRPHPAHLEVVNKMTVEQLLSNIFCYRVYDYVEQLAVVKALPKFLQAHPQVRLVVIDSVAFHFRRDFEDMALRSRLLTSLAQDLGDLADRFDLAVVLTNQVTTKFKANSSLLVPALGESWAHACTTRVMLRWDGDTRVASLLKSPSQKPDTVPFIITSSGVRGDKQSHKRRLEDNSSTSSSSSSSS